MELLGRQTREVDVGELLTVGRRASWLLLVGHVAVLLSLLGCPRWSTKVLMQRIHPRRALLPSSHRLRLPHERCRVHGARSRRVRVARSAAAWCRLAVGRLLVRKRRRRARSSLSVGVVLLLLGRASVGIPIVECITATRWQRCRKSERSASARRADSGPNKGSDASLHGGEDGAAGEGAPGSLRYAVRSLRCAGEREKGT